MAKLTTRAIRERALDLLATQSAGIRFKSLVDMIAAESPETPYNTIFTQVGELPRRESHLVSRPERGLFLLVCDRCEGESAKPTARPKSEAALVGTLPPTIPQLIDLGFEFVGEWTLFDDDLRLALTRHSERDAALYAFVVNGKVRYIGKTRRTLGKRMYSYSRFATSQVTNERNHGRIRAALTEGQTVEVYALVEWEPIEYRGIPIDLAAGMEDALIARMTPDWNGRPKDSSFATSTT